MSVPPAVSLSFTHIKTPQLIGIIAGCLVFSATISAVIFLLYKSGTLSRFRDEMVAGTPMSLKSSKKEDITPQSSMLPELYEHLLTAASTLPLQPSIPILTGERLTLNTMTPNDFPKLLEASNGTALYGESAYDPARIWGWINIKKNENNEKNENNANNSNNANNTSNISNINSSINGSVNSSMNNSINNSGSKNENNSGNNNENNGNERKSTSAWPCDSEKYFRECYQKNVPSDSEHLVIVDIVTQKVVGMVSVVDNRPHDLAIRIDNLWLTPSFQARKYSYEALRLVLRYLFESNYRRVSVEVDMKNIIMRKFIEKCGFQQESIMRKHRIVDRRNRDTAVYIVLNSDWEQIDVKLKKILGMDLRVKVHKIAEIDESSQSKNVLPGPKTINQNNPSQNISQSVPQNVPQNVPSGFSVSQKNRLKKKKSKLEKAETI